MKREVCLPSSLLRGASLFGRERRLQYGGLWQHRGKRGCLEAGGGLREEYRLFVSGQYYVPDEPARYDALGLECRRHDLVRC